MFGFCTITVPAGACVLLNRRCQFAFGDVLNFFVEREDDVRAALALRFAAVEPALPRVRHHHDLFALAADLVSQLVFDSASPFSSMSTKPSTCAARSRFG